MRCPFCGELESQVKDSRPSDDGSSIRRRRHCPQCGGRFTTFERVQLRELTILKRSGRRAPFDREKLVRSISIAIRKRPVDDERVERMVSGIVRQLESLGETELASHVVGEMVMKALKSLDDVAYVRYASVYRDFRKTEDFRSVPQRRRPERRGSRRRAWAMIVTLKLATSLDGRIATASGESRWITGRAAREQVHRLRAMHAGVVVGVDTVIADDPDLTVRLPGFVGLQPARIVMDSRQRMPQTSRLVTTSRRHRTIVVSVIASNKRLTDAGVEVVTVAQDDGRVDAEAALEALRPMAAIMIEGGGQVAASFISRGLVDAIEWFRAPIILGDEGRPAIGGFVLRDLASAPRFRRTSVEVVGEDLWERYAKV